MANNGQKDAVYDVVVSVFQKNGIKFSSGVTDARQLLDKELRKQVVDQLIRDFNAGVIPLTSPQNDMKEYVSGLLSNWLRKDLRLNGGVRHKVKSPGVRKGQQDALIKNLRTLQSTLQPGTSSYQAVQARIDNRLLEIKRDQAPTIDRSAIPAELQQYIPGEE